MVASSAMAVAPNAAHASACCGGGQSVALRLGPEEVASGSLVALGQQLRGRWDKHGTFIASDPATRDRELRVEARAMGKIGRRFQFGAIVPTIFTMRRHADGASSGGGIGDVTALSRWDFVKVGGEGVLPGIAATFALGMPTGRSTDHARDPRGADVTGIGTWEVRPGIAIEKSWWTGYYVIGAMGLGFFAPFSNKFGSRTHLGPRLQAFVAAGKSFNNGLGVTLGLSHDRETGPVVGGVRRVALLMKTSAMLFVSWEINDHWQTFASFQLDLPINSLGRDQLAGTTIGLGVRRAWNVY
ncbi:MAG: hypothetical protein HYV09_35245 [Deltaproteobacteria bacterium]|nr:hypothetical protein [Deltaproteobacteria bacterium]